MQGNRMRTLALTAGLAGMLLSLACAAESERSELRCGWFENPTPANAWLVDRDGAWMVGIQGGHQAEGDWPSFDDGEWMETNGPHGYGCACLRVVVDPESMKVLKIVSGKAQALEVCQDDPALPEPMSN